MRHANACLETTIRGCKVLLRDLRVVIATLALVAAACDGADHGGVGGGGASGHGGSNAGEAGADKPDAGANSAGLGGSSVGGEAGSEGGHSTGGAGRGGTSGAGGTGGRGGTSPEGGTAGWAAGGAGNSAGAAGEGGNGEGGLAGESGQAGQGGSAGEPEFIEPLVPRHTTGAQNTVVILLSYGPLEDIAIDNPPSIIGVTRRLADIADAVRKFSYDKAWLDPIRMLGIYSGAVRGCTDPYSPGNSEAITRYAIERADSEVDFRNVDRIVVMLHNDIGMLSCDINPNGGFNHRLESADGPFSAGVMMMKVNFPVDPQNRDTVAIHEFVHTFGTGHVASIECYDGTALAERVSYSYTPGITNGFPDSVLCPTWAFSALDLMGIHYSQWANIDAPLKKQFGWLGPENIVTTRAGSYALKPLDASNTAAGTLMIQIPIPYTTNWYTLEHRAEAPSPGVYLYLAMGGGRPPTLLPFLLSTAPFGDPGAVPHPLPLGVTSIDAAMDLSVEVISSDAAGANVDITSDPSYVTQCADGVSNETSGGWESYDGDDYSCRIGDGLSELEPAPACYDGMDNDGDGRTDEQDPGCTAAGTLKPEDDHE